MIATGLNRLLIGVHPDVFPLLLFEFDRSSRPGVGTFEEIRGKYGDAIADASKTEVKASIKSNISNVNKTEVKLKNGQMDRESFMGSR